MTAIGAVKRRADKGVLRQLADYLLQQRQLFILLFRPIEAAIAARRLTAQDIQLRRHAVIGLVADHLLIFGHGDSCSLVGMRLFG